MEDKGPRYQIVNIRNIMEEWKNESISIYLCFIDYAKAFDLLNIVYLKSPSGKQWLIGPNWLLSREG